MEAEREVGQASAALSASLAAGGGEAERVAQLQRSIAMLQAQV